MPEISGKNFDIITEVNGVIKSNISQVSGVEVNNAPPSCTSFLRGYDARDAQASCRAPFQNFQFDSATGILYDVDDCNGRLAPVGYYSDGGTILFWDERALTEAGRCGR
jgi:hypothetical protein